MLRECVIDFHCNWDDHLPLLDFSYNNSYHSTISMAPFNGLYGKRCRSPLGLYEVGEFALLGPDFVFEALEKVRVIKDRQKMAQSRQKSFAYNIKRDLEFEVED